MNNEDEVSALRELVQQQQKRIAELEQLLEAPKEGWVVSPISDVRVARHFVEKEEEKDPEPFV